MLSIVCLLLLHIAVSFWISLPCKLQHPTHFITSMLLLLLCCCDTLNFLSSKYTITSLSDSKSHHHNRTEPCQIPTQDIRIFSLETVNSVFRYIFPSPCKIRDLEFFSEYMFAKMPTILDHPFAHAQNIYVYTLVGCCNGLVGIRSGQEILLWNPATKLSNTVPLKDCGPNNNIVSLGFGYDAIEDDFKVVMIVASIVLEEGMNLTSFEIYSVNLDSWITIDVGFQFGWFNSRNDLIVNGNPYWVAHVNENDVLVCFNVLELVFKIVPLPIHYWMSLDKEADLVNWDALEYEDTKIDVNFVDWNGALGTLITNHEVEYCKGIASIECSARIECVNVWVFEKLCYSIEVYGYTESFAHVNGMEKVVVKYELSNHILKCAF
ncbi:hypothetical protein CASFOL_013245 [Castilleja foliolosa]|uniref:F-box associated beta-propeller type 1 domain-containing protein n=1 Tax=Castilleja foliolosa TaxID=1961234 RepID=A0ABD3DNI6_9LAMI